MSSRPLVPPELLGAPRNRWDLAVEVLLAATLVLLPVAFGGVDAFSELAALALVGAAAVVVLLRTAVDRTFAPPRSWTYLPLAAMLALAALQAISWPAAWVAWASPQSVALRQDLLSDLPPATDSDPAARSAISLYPPATWHSLRLLLIGAGVYFVTLATVRTAPQITRLLTIVLGIGAAQAALALLQIFTRADKIYWVVDAGTDRVTSGSFVNYSNFSQFMNLSIGAGLALLLIRLHEPSAPRHIIFALAAD
ncbi:MAG TPA: hypothetical protein PKC18_20495, partial [Lacipirellulaceae bacterium]|nr:hypothetical protein [Lacipirellulaceae bacterium]